MVCEWRTDIIFNYYLTGGYSVAKRERANDDERSTIAWFCLSLQNSRWYDFVEFISRRLSSSSLGHHVYES